MTTTGTTRPAAAAPPGTPPARDQETDPTAGGRAAAAWDLPAQPRAAARARDLTARALRGWHVTDPDDTADIVLMVDELVTNAVVHGTGPVHLALRLDGDPHGGPNSRPGGGPGGALLTAEVSDADPAAPTAPGAPPRVLDWAEAGRGLLLVAALATDHGARPHPPGKTVWFTRRTAPAHPVTREDTAAP
ncbi:ATP-binding protein [Actinomadura sp. NAK00032]|uniref:ATP-binding protein n=1 Tax=Actinomadura sp. NAK00032 TaxID=2742128 RepID=UPI0015913157|nr:ATP-binding protein [Actinomadura sp. NAK00032]QKW36184.1 ATP-binding protein [Actinomadura sp. NAK00032]